MFYQINKTIQTVTNYNGTFQLTFAPDILIQTILYIIQHSNHEQTLHSVFHQLMSIIPCDFTKDLPLPSDIFESLKAFMLSRKIINHNTNNSRIRMDEFIFTDLDCFNISNESIPNSTNIILSNSNLISPNIVLNNSNPNCTSPTQESNALDKSNSTSGNIKDSLDSTSDFFTELDDLLLFEHANNNNDETRISNIVLLNSLPTERYEHNTERNEDIRSIPSTNNSGSSQEINIQKKTKKIFNTNDEQNIKRRTSECINTNYCHNISLFQQMIEKTFSDFIVNRIS